MILGKTGVDCRATPKGPLFPSRREISSTFSLGKSINDILFGLVLFKELIYSSNNASRVAAYDRSNRKAAFDNRPPPDDAVITDNSARQNQLCLRR